MELVFGTCIGSWNVRIRTSLKHEQQKNKQTYGNLIFLDLNLMTLFGK